MQKTGSGLFQVADFNTTGIEACGSVPLSRFPYRLSLNFSVGFVSFPFLGKWLVLNK
jgi:hypothetical protein